jgi:hypothetical protein
MRLHVLSAPTLCIPRASPLSLFSYNFIAFLVLSDLYVTLVFHLSCLYVLVRFISLSLRISYVAFSLFVSLLLSPSHFLSAS